MFNNTNFELYKNGTEGYMEGQSYGKDMIEQYIGKEVTLIGTAYVFDYDLFESDGKSAFATADENFDYIVFWYGASSIRIFGVK